MEKRHCCIIFCTSTLVSRVLALTLGFGVGIAGHGCVFSCRCCCYYYYYYWGKLTSSITRWFMACESWMRCLCYHFHFSVFSAASL